MNKDEEPVICDQHLGVATIGDAAIPENSVICKLQLFAVVLLIGLAVLTIQTRSSQTPNTHSLSFFEPLHIAPHLGDHPNDLVPTHTNVQTQSTSTYIHYSERRQI